MQHIQYKLRTLLVVLPLVCAALSFNFRVYERGPAHLGVQTSRQGWPFAFRRFWARTDGTLSDWNLVNLVLDWHLWVFCGSIFWGLSEHYGRRRDIARSIVYINSATLILTSAICIMFLVIILFTVGERYAVPFLFGALIGAGIGLAGVSWARRGDRAHMIADANETGLGNCNGDE